MPLDAPCTSETHWDRPTLATDAEGSSAPPVLPGLHRGEDCHDRRTCAPGPPTAHAGNSLGFSTDVGSFFSPEIFRFPGNGHLWSSAVLGKEGDRGAGSQGQVWYPPGQRRAGRRAGRGKGVLPLGRWA